MRKLINRSALSLNQYLIHSSKGFFANKVKYSGQHDSKEFQVALHNREDKPISFWRDIPLKEDGMKPHEFNICIEIPRNRLAKFEVYKELPNHPIKQDTRKNKFNPAVTELRYYAQFPYFNYGYFPQTWENSLKQTKEGYKVEHYYKERGAQSPASSQRGPGGGVVIRMARRAAQSNTFNGADGRISHRVQPPSEIQYIRFLKKNN